MPNSYDSTMALLQTVSKSIEGGPAIPQLLRDDARQMIISNSLTHVLAVVGTDANIPRAQEVIAAIKELELQTWQNLTNLLDSRNAMPDDCELGYSFLEHVKGLFKWTFARNTDGSYTFTPLEKSIPSITLQVVAGNGC